ncbi:MAG: hypothetical protein KDA31_13205 [Phycisphaerales bacterium]|nr:hypothetical protein [Phycisphaerales bacterium]MCB9835221.1 hypothetical protein [Phycisphaera sp.]
MSRSFNARRPYVRQTKSITRRANQDLVSKAGQVPIDRPMVEQLEPRKLLFSITIDGSNQDRNGDFYEDAYFSYFIPYYFSSAEPNEDEDMTLIEDLNDEMQGTPAINPGQQRVLAGSNILVRNPAIGLNRASLRINAPVDMDGQPITEQTRLDVDMAFQDDTFSLITLATNNANGLRNIYTSVQFTVGNVVGGIGSVGLLNGAIQVELLFDGEVQRTFDQADLTAINPNGTGVYTFNAVGTQIGAFDEIRFTQTETAGMPGVVAAEFSLDDFIYVPPSTMFTPITGGRVFGAYIRITGDIGATATLTDLYGRDMEQTIRLGMQTGTNFVWGDFDGDGIPEYNDGIGRIDLSGFGTGENSSVYMTGGLISTFTGVVPVGAEITEGGFAWTFPTTINMIDNFESVGFGFETLPNGERGANGLPPQAAQVIIGSPYLRPQLGYNPDGTPLGNAGNFNFTDAEQGVFLNDGSSIGDVTLNAILMGSSQFDGSVGAFSTGVNYGSLSVAGDLTAYIVASDSGVRSPDPDDDNTTNNFNFYTGSQILVGRSLGQFIVGGKNLSRLVVDGDLSSPATAPPNDVLNYYEREIVYGYDPGVPDPIRDYLRTNRDIGGNRGLPLQQTRAMLFGDSMLRNDTIMSAEFLNSPGTATIVNGYLGGFDPVNTGEDAGDVFGFAVDGTREIVIESLSFASAFAGQVRIMDSNGRTVAATNLDEDTGFGSVIRYQPTAPGVYYLVVNHIRGGATNNQIDLSYSILVSGLAPTTLGSYRTGAGFGTVNDNREVADDGDLVRPVVVLNSGSAGAIRVGTGFVNRGGAEVTSETLFNTLDSADVISQMAGFSFSAPGNLYNITTGGDIGSGTNGTPVPNDFTVGGNFGTLNTGRLGLLGGRPDNGDVAGLTLNVGGQIAMLDIGATIGSDTDNGVEGAGLPIDAAEPTIIRTGLNEDLEGHIGLIRVGSHIAGDTLIIDTSASPGAIVGGLLIAQDVPMFGADMRYGDDFGIFDGFNGIDLQLGQDSDIRFVDTPLIDLQAASDLSLPIMTGQTLTLVDDAGGRLEISVTSLEPFPINIGRVYVVPIDGSEGVAIARIEIDDLSGTGTIAGGRTLRIRGENGQSVDDIISIGRILIQNSDAQSAIVIEGSAQIDVLRIDAPNGLATITQNTPRGDIVAIDTGTLGTLRIQQGDLGRTELLDWGPSEIGPFLGIQNSLSNAVEGAIGIDPMVIDEDWNGNMFRPTNDPNTDAGNAYLDDVGAPFDGYLNGIIVRGGGIQLIEVSGGVGDVISQDAMNDIITVRANQDNVSEDGSFDGIFGSIFSGRDIDLVEIGQGLAGPGRSPLAGAGIFAQSYIDTVRDNASGASAGPANIEGVITAATLDETDPDPLNPRISPTVGINQILLSRGGSIRDAYISNSTRLDEFWISTAYGNRGEFDGFVNLIRVTNGDIFRSTLVLNQLNTLTITNGFFDASDLSVLTEVTNTIEASGFRNSTIGGDLLEFRLSRIIVGEDLERLRAVNGDIVDTAISVTGSVVRSITANSIVRTNVAVSNTLNSIILASDMLASNITTGQLRTMTVGNSIRTSSIDVGGPLISLAVANEISRSEITVSGPDGRIDEISVVNDIGADIVSSGPIGTIESTAGDIRGSVATTTERGDIELISAFRDLAIETDIGGDLLELVAGRNIGDADNPSVILVRGQVGSLDVSGGRLFSDLRVGQGITSVVLGAVANKPSSVKDADGDIEAFGRIQSVQITGDYDGSIISESGGIGNVTITNGSFLPDAAIIARDGGIGSVIIVAGHLMGDIFADQTIGLIRVEHSSDGVFGDIGINPNLSSGTASSDSNRNQLPPGVLATSAIDGPVIASLRGINRIIVTGGSIFDATIYAGTNLGLLSVAGNVQSDGQQADDDSVTIAAGDQIQNVQIIGGVSDTLFIAGLSSFGSSPIFNILESTYTDRAGGTGADADTIKSGRIQNVEIGSNAFDVTFAAGMTAGDNGMYGDSDDRHVIGFSYVEDLTIGGTMTNVTVTADRKWYNLNGTTITPAIQNSTPSLNNAGRNAANADGLLEPLTAAFTGGGVNLGNLGVVVDFGTTQTFAWNGTTFTIEATSSQAGAANADPSRGIVWDFSRGRVILANTRLADGVIITVLDNDNNDATPLPELIDFDIVSNDDAAIGLIRINGNLRGGSDIIVDTYARTIDIDDYDGDGQIVVGVDVGSFTVGRFAGGSIRANYVDSFTSTRSIVASSGNVPFITFTGNRVFSVAQNLTGNINVERTISQGLSVGGDIAQSLIRAGGSITNITADNLNRARISVANTIGSINVLGDVFDSAILAGGDLGSDAQIGTGGNSSTTDRATSGNIGSVVIGGDFNESDIVAGYLRGSDGFFGTEDDVAASGVSSIGNITIGGQARGSNVNSESYTIASAGTLAFVTAGGTDATSIGNLAIDEFTGLPLPIQVTNFNVLQDARIYTATFTFNQDIDVSTFNAALSIQQVISEGNFLPLVKPTDGVPGSGDYSIEFDAETRMAIVTVDRAITDKDIADTGPAAGVYRITLDADVLRSRVSQARLDGDGDGFADVGDDYSVDDIIGDAGDVAGPRDPEQIDVNMDSSVLIDFFGAVDLDQVFDSNLTPDSVPDPNTPFVLRGALGDHPDRDLNNFGFSGDVDVYQVTLQAGQILQLGEMTGAAFGAQRSLYFQPTGNGTPELLYSQIGSQFNANAFFSFFGQESDQALPLPISPTQLTDRSDGAAILIKESGTFYIVIESGDSPTSSWYTPGAVNNAVIQPNQIGNYAFSVNIFDDGNTGFSAGNDSGNGTPVVHAPPLSLFAAPTDSVVIGDYTFVRTAGADGVFGNSDDVVSGSSADGERTSTRQGSRLVNTVSSSIGYSGVTGLPGDVSSDVDIWHLNNRQPIAPGTLMTITVKLADIGTDLGSTITTDAVNFDSLSDFSDFSQSVQFGLFDTTNSFGIGDADMVFSPTDFSSRAGTPDTVIAQNGVTRYGYNADGDFYITFVVPPALGGASNASGTFAIYMQGAFRGDYELEIVTQGTGSYTRRSQNVLIETRGGTLDWLAVDGAPVEVGGFDARSLGFTGRVNNVPVNTYVLDQLVTRLNNIYSAAGYDVTFSTNPADFEFQDFSTVFLSSDHDPIGLILDNEYGYSEHSDPFNTDNEDEAVVFTPDLTDLGLTPSANDLDRFIDSLTASTGRRVGELVGLRMTQSDLSFSDIDLFNINSVGFGSVFGDYIISSDSRRLASHLGQLDLVTGRFTSLDDTGFFLGNQNAESLLDRILAN